MLSIVFCIFGLSKFQSNTEDVVQWLPDSSPSRNVYNQFEAKFGSDDFLLVTWEGCTINDPRLAQFCETLVSKDKDNLIQSVVNGSDVIDRLRSEIELSTKYIVKRFKGIFFGLDNPEQTLALIELTKTGSADRRESLRQIEFAIAETNDLKLEDVSFGGYPYVGINIDNHLRDSFLYFLLPSVFFASIVSLCCLKNILLSSLVFLAAMGAAACSIAIVPIFGFKFGGLMSIIPALVYILTTSGSIHLIHYSLDAIGDTRKLLSISWKPCCISALTTAIGMLSLMRSSFPAIRSFGLFCATGAGFALLFQLIVVPWLLLRLGKKGQLNLAQRSDQHQSWNLISGLIQRHRIVLSLAGVLAIAFSAWGLSRLSARVDVGKLFSEKSEFIAKMSNLETQIGPLDQSELVIEFKEVPPEDFHVRARLVHKLQRHVASLQEVGATHSLLNYLPREPTGNRIRTRVKRTYIQSRIDERRDELAKSRFLDISSGSETWRISLRFPFTQETDVEQQQELVLDQASDAIDRLMEQDDFAAFTSPIRLSYTGKNHLFHSAQATLLEDFYRNFILAFIIITPVLMIVLRSFWLGVLAMLPNLFPIVVLFGSLGWLNWPVDLAIAMTASVALGIAVDDTTHFLIRFRTFGGSTANIVAPVRKAISQCGPAMMHTTAIGSAGLLVYGISEMTVVSNFSISITCMLILALIADILILPALLMLHVKKANPEPGQAANVYTESQKTVCKSG